MSREGRKSFFEMVEESHLMTSAAPGLPSPWPSASSHPGCPGALNLKRSISQRENSRGWGQQADGVARPDIGLCPGDTPTAAAAHREAPLRLAASLHIYQDTPTSL